MLEFEHHLSAAYSRKSVVIGKKKTVSGNKTNIFKSRVTSQCDGENRDFS
jgi:hypothetical protein